MSDDFERFGKQIIKLTDGGPQEPSRVLEAFSEANGRVRLTLRPLTHETGFLYRHLSRFDMQRLCPIIPGDVLEYTRYLIWKRVI